MGVHVRCALSDEGVHDQMGGCMVSVYALMGCAWSLYILKWHMYGWCIFSDGGVCGWCVSSDGAEHGYCISSDCMFMVTVYSQMGLCMVGMYHQMACEDKSLTFQICR